MTARVCAQERPPGLDPGSVRSRVIGGCGGTSVSVIETSSNIRAVTATPRAQQGVSTPAPLQDDTDRARAMRRDPGRAQIRNCALTSHPADRYLTDRHRAVPPRLRADASAPRPADCRQAQVANGGVMSGPGSKPQPPAAPPPAAPPPHGSAARIGRPRPPRRSGPRGLVYADSPTASSAFIIDAIILFVINFIVFAILGAIGLDPWSPSIPNATGIGICCRTTRSSGSSRP